MQISKFFMMSLVVVSFGSYLGAAPVSLNKQIQAMQKANLALVDQIVSAQQSHDENNGPAMRPSWSEMRARNARIQASADALRDTLLGQILTQEQGIRDTLAGVSGAVAKEINLVGSLQSKIKSQQKQNAAIAGQSYLSEILQGEQSINSSLQQKLKQVKNEPYAL